MANNYTCATVYPYFPDNIADQFAGEFPAGVSWEAMGSGLVYIYVEEGCEDWDEFDAVLQKMLKAWQDSKEGEPQTFCTVQGCYYCDKMRQGEFGGFAHFITVDDVQFMGTESWLQEMENNLREGGGKL